MQTKKLHSWNLSYSQAAELQKRLASKVQFTPLKKPPKLIAGLDCAFTKDAQIIIAAAVVIKLPDFDLIETTTASRKVTFPYIPGLLSFREAAVCIAAAKKLALKFYLIEELADVDRPEDLKYFGDYPDPE